MARKAKAQQSSNHEPAILGGQRASTTISSGDLSSEHLAIAGGLLLTSGGPLVPEDKLLKKFVIVSFLIHAVAIGVRPGQWFRSSPPVAEEWSMDADLIPDLTLNSPKDSAIPKAAPAEDPTVKANMLPQLTKKMAIQDSPEAQDKNAMLDPEAKKIEDEAEKKQEQLVAVPKQDPDEQNRLKMDDALRRLALEKLKAEKKEAKETKAPSNEDLARLKEAVAKGKNINAGVVGSGHSAEKCLGPIRQAVHRNYALPEAYNLKDAKIVVTIAIVLTETGDLTKADIVESSGDSVFDQLAFKAVRDSAPLPPCPEQAGKQILLKMNP